jgi:ABC-type branched-subunit amino acid transport system ATPase component
MTLLAVDAVEKRFGGLPAVDGVTFGLTRARSSPSSGPTAPARAPS